MTRAALAVAASALSLVCCARAGDRVVHCRYTAIVVARGALDAYAACTARYSELTLAADRPFVVERARPQGVSGDFLACENVPHAGRASRAARCTGSGGAGRRVPIRLGTTSLRAAIRLTFEVVAPFPNGASLTLRARCA